MKKKVQITTGLDDGRHSKEKFSRFDTKFNDGTDSQQKATTEDEKTKQVSYFQLYRYCSLYDKILLSIAITCSFVAGTGTPLVMIFFGDITGNIVKFAIQVYNETLRNVSTTESENALMDSVTSFAVNCSIIGGATFILTYISIFLFMITCARQLSKMRAMYMKSVLNQDIGWYDLNQTGDFSSRITDDMSKIEEGLGDKVATFCFFFSSFITGIIIALFYGWKLALICLTSLPVNTLSLGFIAWLTTKYSMKEVESYGAAGAIAEEVLGAIKTVFAFGGQQKEIDRYREHLQVACKNNTKRAFLTGVSNGIMFFVIFATYAMAFYFGITFVLEEKHLPESEQVYTAGSLITIFFCVLMSLFTLTQCMPYFQIFGIAQGAAAKIFNIIDNKPEINLSKGKGKKIENFKGHIKFDSVEFNYPARRDVKVLKGVNLEILPGETVALVGSSGCGKSTCVQLLQRFYDPINGKITVDDTDVKDLDLSWYREKIGVVGQEPILFATTIAENIKFGNKSATEEDIIKAAKKANAHSFITSLPDGYSTLVGDRGSQLSGGQKQRIAIARALVREPTILLLDEATSALDTNSEVQVQKAIDSISKECTTIIVAHRLSTIRNANKIIVFSDGQIVETGAHDALMERNGVYHNLVIAQISKSESELTESLDKDHSLEEEKVEAEILNNDLEDGGKAKVKNLSAIFNVLALNKPEWWQITTGALSAVISGATMPVFAVVFGDVMGVFAYEDPQQIREEGNRYSLYFLIIAIASGVSTFLQWYMISVAGEKLTKRVRALLFETILRQEPAWYDQKENGVGAVCAKLSSDAANIQGASGHPIVVALSSISSLLIAVAISMYLEWRLSLVSMSIMPLVFLGTYFEMSFSQEDSSGSRNSLENSTKIAVDAISNVKTVASLGCEETFYTLYTTELIPYYKKTQRSAHLRGIILGLSRSLMNFAYIIAFYYGGVLIVEEKLDYTILFKVSEALISAAWSIGNVMAFSPNFQKGIIAAGKMFNLISREPKIKDGPNSTYTNWSKGYINYDKIKFSYPTRPNTNILDSLDLFINEGKTIALVGPSGCGKSTIVQLLQRFYEPSSGNVSIGDIDLRNIKIDSLRAHLGIVSQEPNLFDRTIEENIAYGDNRRLVARTEIIEAAKNANIHNFINSLPLGYATRLGERGTQISGGQKQRIAIARALVRNPHILLLDEATSALDVESEKVVQDALDKAKLGRTCITIAHRLTTIKDVDVICVLHKGKIVEQGTHNELLKMKGLYYKLHSMQQKQS